MTTVAQAESNHEISYMRQRGWFDPQENAHAQVTLVGVGGIGSPLALALAKLGIPKLTLIDPDTVERHNLPNQLFEIEAPGGLKVNEVADHVIAPFSPTSVNALPYSIEADGWRCHPNGNIGELRLSGVVCSGLDSMEARQNLWDRAIRRKRGVALYIDGRLAGEHIVVIAVNPTNEDHVRWYESECLYSDDEGMEAPCTRQSIIDVGFAVASLMTRAVRRFYAGEPIEQRVWMDQANLTITKESIR